MSKNKLYKFYGVLLSEICEMFNLDKGELHNSLKKAKNINSLRDLSASELYLHIVDIQSHFASEYGVEVPSSGATLSEIFNNLN